MADGIDLGKKLGPFPLGVWLIVVGGGLGLAYFINRGQATADERQLAAEPGVGTGLVPAGAVIQPPPETGNEVEETNVSWGRDVTNWLIAQGHDAALADNAVRKYLASEPLSLQEQSLLNLALAVHGAPPEPLAPTETPSGQPQGAPAISAAIPRTARVASFVNLTGRVTIGGNDPGVSLVTVTSYRADNKTIARRWFVTTTDDGTFSTRVGGWGAKGTRRYVVSWKGAIRELRIRIT